MSKLLVLGINVHKWEGCSPAYINWKLMDSPSLKLNFHDARERKRGTFVLLFLGKNATF
jgi:hypothetical protein